MKRGQPPLGYTILETMIFLLVSGVLLVSALLIFNGQQNRTRFTQGLKEMDSTVNGVIGEVASGYYPGNDQLSCGLILGVVPIVLNSGGTGQGSNENCVFLGKSLKFGGDQYSVNTIVGRRLETDNRTQIQNLEDPDGPGPKVGAQPSVANGANAGMADLSERRLVSSGMYVYDMYQVRNGVSSSIGSVAFVFTLASYQAGSSDPVSGSTGIDMIGIDGTTLNGTALEDWSKTKEMQDADRDTDQVVICFSQDPGGGGRKGAIVIGGQGNLLATTVINDAAADTEPGRQCS